MAYQAQAKHPKVDSTSFNGTTEPIQNPQSLISILEAQLDSAHSLKLSENPVKQQTLHSQAPIFFVQYPQSRREDDFIWGDKSTEVNAVKDKIHDRNEHGNVKLSLFSGNHESETPLRYSNAGERNQRLSHRNDLHQPNSSQIQNEDVSDSEITGAFKAEVRNRVQKRRDSPFSSSSSLSSSSTTTAPITSPSIPAKHTSLQTKIIREELRTSPWTGNSPSRISGSLQAVSSRQATTRKTNKFVKRSTNASEYFKFWNSKCDVNSSLRELLLEEFPEKSDVQWLMQVHPYPDQDINPHEKIHVFIDFSNIYVGFMQAIRKRLKKSPNADLDIKYQTIELNILIAILHRGRPTGDLRVSGSRNEQYIDSFYLQLQKYDYNVKCFKRVPDEISGKSKEQGVDESLHAAILSAICRYERHPSIMVVASGDGNVSSHTSFPQAVYYALEKGFKVEVVGWGDSFTRKYDYNDEYDFEKYRKDGKLRIIALDPYLDHLLFLMKDLSS